MELPILLSFVLLYVCAASSAYTIHSLCFAILIHTSVCFTILYPWQAGRLGDREAGRQGDKHTGTGEGRQGGTQGGSEAADPETVGTVCVCLPFTS